MSDWKARAERGAANEGDLPAPWGSVFGALDALDRLGDARFRHVQDLAQEVVQLHIENAELRDAMVALSNRIEAVQRIAKASSAYVEDAST